MLSDLKNLGLESQNHENLVSDFWIRSSEVKALSHSQVERFKICRLTAIFVHIYRDPRACSFLNNQYKEKTRAGEIIQLRSGA